MHRLLNIRNRKPRLARIEAKTGASALNYDKEVCWITLRGNAP